MISYKYKLYRTDKTKHLDKMLREAAFVWNHALALQKRYYRMYGKYIGINRMCKHFAKRINRNLLHSQTVQEILDRLAAQNILRQGIAELESTSKTPSARRAHVRLHPRISSLQG